MFLLIFKTLLGDFNIDLMQVNSEQKALKKYLITDGGYTQFINQFPTDYRTQIDHVYINVPQWVQSAGTLESYYSDHKPIYRKHRHISDTLLPKIFASNWASRTMLVYKSKLAKIRRKFVLEMVINFFLFKWAPSCSDFHVVSFHLSYVSKALVPSL